jgi:hypothetical protein
MIQPSMQELLQHIDSDYYRSVRLLIVHAELEQLRQARPAPADVGSRGRLRIDNALEEVGIRRAARLAE